MIILRDIRTTSVGLFLAYTQDDVKSEIFIEILIGLGIKGSHTREWVIRREKIPYDLNDTGLECFEKLKAVLEARGLVYYQVYPYVWYRE